jgi:RNA polymerase sigma-70 factor (ECF subfamily)
VDRDTWQTEQFERNRPHLRTVAYRMLGSGAEADDAVQEAWLRLSRADATGIENMQGWLTVIVSRICLDMLRARRARREELFEDWLDAPIVTLEEPTDPEQEAVMADSVGLALLVVLQTLGPAERLAFVLHDMFGVPFEEIAPIVERSVPATRQLASRARRRVRGGEPEAAAASLTEQRRVVEAFLAASRNGDFEALLEVLDPDVEFRVERGRLGPAIEVHGAEDVAAVVLEQGSPRAHLARPAIVNGAVGVVVAQRNRVLAMAICTVVGERMTAMTVVADPDRLARVRI